VNFINNNTYYRPQQNQGWNQQPRQGNYQGNNFPPLRELVASQSKLLDQMTRKLTSNDKTLKTYILGWNFASAIKNQHSFNKMLESQLAQLAVVVPPLEKGKIPGQPEDLETANLVDIHNATQCYIEPAAVQWINQSLPEKMGDPRRSVIPISIGCHSFLEAICDFGASVNIMPKVIYEKILNDPMLYTNMHL